MFPNTNVDTAVDKMYSTLNGILEFYVPTYKVSKLKCPQWFDANLRRLIKEKRLAHKNYKLKPCSSNYLYFSNQRAKCKYFSKSCYTNYLRKIQNNLTSKPKDFWRFVKDRYQDNLILSSMIFNDLTHENY